MRFLKFLWRVFEKIAVSIGNIITNLFLFIFYYTIFALFALPFKIFSKPLRAKSKKSNWTVRKTTLETLKYFQNE